MIEPYQQSQTPELLKLLRTFEEHEVSNPDDDPNLSGDAFRESTDETSAQLLEQIEEIARISCFTSDGSPQPQTNAAIRRAGFQINEAGGPGGDNYTTTLQIKTGHGVITVDRAKV